MLFILNSFTNSCCLVDCVSSFGLVSSDLFNISSNELKSGRRLARAFSERYYIHSVQNSRQSVQTQFKSLFDSANIFRLGTNVFISRTLAHGLRVRKSRVNHMVYTKLLHLSFRQLRAQQ